MLGPPRGIGVEALEQRHALREHVMVIGRRGEQRTDRDVDAARFVVRVLPVTQIGLVNDLGEPHEATVS